MRRKSTLADDDGFPITYSQAARRLEITEQALRNKLAKFRREYPDQDIISLSALRSIRCRNQLRDHAGSRITQKQAATYLDIPITRLQRLLFILRSIHPRISDGGDIEMTTLQKNLREDGVILFDLGYAPNEE